MGKDKKRVDFIIFDLDGTLIDSKKAIANSVNFTLKKLSLEPKSQDEIDSYIGAGVRGLVKDFLGRKQQFFERALEIFQDDFERNSQRASVLYSGVRETLDFFKDKKKAIVTNRFHKFAKMALREFSILNYFEEIVGGDNITCVKPSACPMDGLIKKLVTDKEKTMMVGDMRYDILAGKASGVVTCGVTYGIGKKEDVINSNPDYVINNISELKDILE